jgi:hypothetical protein
MKKISQLLLIMALVTFTACNQSQQNAIADQKSKQDSIEKAQKETPTFGSFFQTFIESANFDAYVHKELGVHISKNPGAVCAVKKSQKAEIMQDLKKIPIKNMFDRKPKGDFCQGYPGEANGFYYTEINKDDLPSYYDESTNADKKLTLPSNITYQKFEKVNVIIKESFHADLYFVLIDSKWYLIAQNFCDCSA